MYPIIISIVLTLYALVLADFSLLFREISVNADSMNSAQAFYTAEAGIEKTWYRLNESPESEVNELFFTESLREEENEQEDFLDYNQETGAHYFNRQMSLNEPDLKATTTSGENNSTTKESVYMITNQNLDPHAIYGLEARSSNQFTLREVLPGNNFNEISFDYNQGEENSEIAFEIFIFPQNGNIIDFKNFESLKKGEEGSVKYMVLNSKDPTQNGKNFNMGTSSLIADFGRGGNYYKKQIRVSGLNPLINNYIFRFQTLDNKPVHYKLSAFNQNQSVMLPNVMQTIDVIGATPNGLYQRIKIQRQIEAPLLRGLNFVHFSNEAIDK